ncbi:hypothetical protein M378DRAFT_543707 [Amanita muscaria Koide BX008]|uniref:Uncharacterized protein n=1 Tax=Amanita muscaria (strain Koide BX008) TaxID=946122 RepID=A0A0C2SPG7_AMAMK|nr:hypothetical protein M378DRAFT_543707 [Amanita muscaria Koide BX008]
MIGFFFLDPFTFDLDAEADTLRLSSAVITVFNSDRYRYDDMNQNAFKPWRLLSRVRFQHGPMISSSLLCNTLATPTTFFIDGRNVYWHCKTLWHFESYSDTSTVVAKSYTQPTEASPSLPPRTHYFLLILSSLHLEPRPPGKNLTSRDKSMKFRSNRFSPLHLSTFFHRRR